MKGRFLVNWAIKNIDCLVLIMSVWFTSSVPNVITNLVSSQYVSGWVLPSNRLMEVCRWMGSHLNDWIDYNGFALSLELLE